MKLHETKIARQWRTYAGPKDERLEAESCKIYRVGFWLLSAGVTLSFVYQATAAQVAWMHGVVGSAPEIAIDPLTAWFLLVLVILCVMQTRRGFVETNRFGQTDTFPSGYFSLIAGLVGLGFAVVIWAMRCIAEVQVVGIGQVSWLANLAVGLVEGAFCWVLVLLLSYLQFRFAKRNRIQIEKGL